MSGGARRGAFTLIEVIATLALAGVVLPVTVHGTLLALDVTGLSADRSQAAALGETLLAELLAERNTQDAESSGDFGEENPRFRWRAVWEVWDGPGLSQLQVTVTWTRRGYTQSLTLTTLARTGGEG